MSSSLTNILRQHQRVDLDDNFSPKLMRLSQIEDRQELTKLLLNNPQISVFDSIESQLFDLIKLKNPKRKFKHEDANQLIKDWLGNTSIYEYGVWVYYPWSSKLVHLLDENEFVEVRTIRNRYKLTEAEQKELLSKRIGIIGLSVGQSIGLTLAMERSCGELRIADFDKLELSNMNRLKSQVSNIGLSKTMILAREIAEIDPFIKIKIFKDGINEANLNSFILDGGKLDLIIEECDSLEIKIATRIEARKNRVPVIMDTSDRGLIDLERYDIAENYPLLHGLIDESKSSEFYSSLTTSEDKLPYILPILGVDSLSTRLAASGLQVGETITTWPQLASDIAIGSGITTLLSRKILLGEQITSFRKWVDVESNFLGDKDVLEFAEEQRLSNVDIANYFLDFHQYKLGDYVERSALMAIIEAGTKAPSAGNSQKWKFVIKDSNVFVLIDKTKVNTFSDNFNIASLINVGCAIENMVQFSNSIGLGVNVELFNESRFPVAASLGFYTQKPDFSKLLADQIEHRCTTRSNSVFFNGNKAVYDVSEREFSNQASRLLFSRDKDAIYKVAKLICQADRIRFMNLQGHHEFFNGEIRWTTEQSETMRDGLDINQFELSELDKVGLKLLQRQDVIRFLRSINGGQSLEKISSRNFDNADAIGYTLVKDYSHDSLIQNGRLIERFWLYATKMNLGIFPMTVIPMMTSFIFGDPMRFNDNSALNELVSIDTEIREILKIEESWRLSFMFRTNGVTSNILKSPRHNPMDKIVEL